MPLSGLWEVDVPKKAGTNCFKCGCSVGAGELRFRWCPSADSRGATAYFHIQCAYSAGSKRGGQFAKVERSTIRKSLGLTKLQRDLLTEVLGAPNEAAVKALVQGATRSAQGPDPVALPTREPAAAIKRARNEAPVVGAPAKRAKAKAAPQPSSASAQAKKKPAAASLDYDMDLFSQHRQAVSALSNDKLKALLKANDQSRSGNKALLVAKCADGAAFGKLPRCPKCFGGKIKFRLAGPDGQLRSLFRIHGGAYGEDKENDKKEDGLKTKKRYYCTGYFDDDEKLECDWQADTVVRENWSAK